jgi:hypothetical protein
MERSRPSPSPSPSWHASKAAKSSKATWHATRTFKWISSSVRTIRWCAATQKEFKTKLIIGLPLFGVGQDLVGLRDFFELLDCDRVVFIFIGVPF